MDTTVVRERVLGPVRGIPPRARRLASFVTASFVLHALTLVSVPPSGVAGAPYRGPLQPAPLHATLNARSVAEPAPEASPDTAASAQPERSASEAREGVPGGANLPFPDKWYTAEEVDVRAQPLGQIDLEYPDELEGTGIRGRVLLLLHIDERGVVRNLRVTEAQPLKLFDAAAMRAWKNVRFSPAQKAGAAVKSQKLLEVGFTPS
jgi:periplasmic protein TonB